MPTLSPEQFQKKPIFHLPPIAKRRAGDEVDLIPAAYSKPCQISKIMRHIENPGIVRTVYSGIFMDIFEAYSGVVEEYGAIIRHIRNSA